MRREDRGKRARTVELEMSKSHYELTAPANSRARNPPAPERMAQKYMAFRPQARPHPPLHCPLFTFPLLQTRAPPPPSPPPRKPLGQAAGGQLSHPVRDRKRSLSGRALSDRCLARGVPLHGAEGARSLWTRTRTRLQYTPSNAPSSGACTRDAGIVPAGSTGRGALGREGLVRANGAGVRAVGSE